MLPEFLCRRSDGGKELTGLATAISTGRETAAQPDPRAAAEISSVVVDLDDASFDRAMTALRDIRDSGAVGTPHHDPRWLRAFANQAKFSLRLVICSSAEGAVGLLPLVVYPASLNLQLGDFVFFSWPVTRITVHVPPLVAVNAGPPDDILRSLFATLAESLPRNAAVFFDAVPDDSLLASHLQGRVCFAGAFLKLVFGRPYQHRFISLPQSYDHYLKQLSSRTRSDLKRTRRRFIDAVAKDYSVRCFTTVDDAPDFVRDGVGLSEKTHQYQFLGGGLRDRDYLERLYRTAAELGWFRSYILYVRGKAAAFQVGLIHEGVFHAMEIGYDPELAKLQLGIFLHTEILQDLCTVEPAIKRFDFGNADNIHKQRLSTDHTGERYYYLFPRNLRGALAYHSIRATNAVSAFLGRLVRRLGVMKKVRDWLRRLNARRQIAE